MATNQSPGRRKRWSYTALHCSLINSLLPTSCRPIWNLIGPLQIGAREASSVDSSFFFFFRGLVSSNRTTALKAGSRAPVGPTGGHGVGSGGDQVSPRFSQQRRSRLEPQEKLICEMRAGFLAFRRSPSASQREPHNWIMLQLMTSEEKTIKILPEL